VAATASELKGVSGIFTSHGAQRSQKSIRFREMISVIVLDSREISDEIA
jgi:hypothetical protein